LRVSASLFHQMITMVLLPLLITRYQWVLLTFSLCMCKSVTYMLMCNFKMIS
jgi:hypothetical protein